MAQTLILNPSPRRRRRKASHKRRARRSNPFALSTRRHRKRHARRRNPLFARTHRRHRRRRNPIGGNLLGGLGAMVKNALIGAGGSIAVDAVMHQINPMLPASLQPDPANVSINDAVKILATVALGRGLRGMTRGMSQVAAQGALTVQMNGIVRKVLPANVTGMLSYYGPAVVTNGTVRLQPTALQRYTAPGSRSPLLSRYTRAGSMSPLLSMASMREREGIKY